MISTPLWRNALNGLVYHIHQMCHVSLLLKFIFLNLFPPLTTFLNNSKILAAHWPPLFFTPLETSEKLFLF